MNTIHHKSPKFVRTLLATTCLTAATGTAAFAGTITEGVPPAPADFPTSGPGYLLPVGTDTVFGTKESQSDTDWFEFQGLLAGSPFSLQAFFVPSGTEVGLRVNVFDTSNTLLGSGTLEQGSANSGPQITGIVPIDGNLITNIFSCNCFNSTGNYEVQLTADVAATPEPSTLPVLGLAAASALAWRRKRKNQLN